MSTYNGWTNYATWRVNLEMIDGMDAREMGWHKLDKFDLADALKEFCGQSLEDQCLFGGRGASSPMVLSYALAFLSDVNWQEIAQSMIEAYTDGEEEEEEKEEEEEEEAA